MIVMVLADIIQGSSIDLLFQLYDLVAAAIITRILLNSASPVLPRTSPSPLRSLAVPLVTTSRIIGRSRVEHLRADQGARSPVDRVVWRPSISWGTGVFPAATVAAASAIPNGLTNTLP